MARPDEAFLGLYEHPFVGPDGRITQIWYDALQALNARSNSSGAGTVTSVALTAPPEFTVTGSPVTANGTIAIDKATESANTVWAGPTTGAAAQPAFRALVAADVPSGFVTGSSLTSGAVIVGAGGSTIAAAANSVAILRSTTSLTDAQIKALPTTRVTLIAAPGAGLAIRPILGTVYAKTTAGAYTNIDASGVMGCRFSSNSQGLSYVPNDPAITNGSTTLLSDLIGTTTNQRATLTPTQQTEGVDDWGPVPFIEPTVAGFTNLPLQVDIDNNGAGNLTGGNAANTLTFIIYYVIETVP